MQAVFEVVKHVFWSDGLGDRSLWPSPEQIAKSNVHLGDLASMAGRERVRTLRECGVHESHIPVFLRALHHLTALHESGRIEDRYKVHRHLSAQQWSPFAAHSPLLGFPLVNSEEFQGEDICSAHIDSTCVEHARDGEHVLSASQPETGSMANSVGPPEDTIETIQSSKEGGDNGCGASLRSEGARYTGLLNQGATCYLNSLLQALFHLSEFRTMIFQMPTQEEVRELKDPDCQVTKSIPYALQRLFCRLQMGGESVGTTELTASFGWSSSDSFIQHDVHELTRILLDNLEEKLSVAIATQPPSVQQTPLQSPHQLRLSPAYSGISASNSGGGATPSHSTFSGPLTQAGGDDRTMNAIRKLFVGTMENYVHVEEANYYSSREEPFYDLQLVVKNRRDINESFDHLVQAEILDGKNKYCLERDGKKTYHRAKKGVRLRRTPPIMLLHLARFDFDLERGDMVKVLSRFDYCSTLDLSSYMPHAARDETQYTLSSVLVHSGPNAGFGHYFCYVRCQDGWFKFNDEQVSPASLKEVFGANFGGTRTNFWGTEIPQTTNAYMLVYVRTADIHHLLRPISPEEMPPHVVEQLRIEAQEKLRIQREKAEDHLYGRIHIIRQKDIASCPSFLHDRLPAKFRKNPYRTLRVLLSSEALPELHKFVEGCCGIAPSDQFLWCSASRTLDDGKQVDRLQSLITPGLLVSDLVADPSQERECCVLATSIKDTSVMRCCGTSSNVENSSSSASVFTSAGTDNTRSATPPVYLICHHKFYDPLELKVFFLGSSITQTTEPYRSVCTVLQSEDSVRDMVAALPDNSKHLFNHHLQMQRGKPILSPESGSGGLSPQQCQAQPLFPKHEEPPTVNTDGSMYLHNYQSTGPSAATDTHQPQSNHHNITGIQRQSVRARPSGRLTAMCEKFPGCFFECTEATVASSGDVFVWQEEIRPEDMDNVAYPDVTSFQHFLQCRVPVEIRLNAAPDYPVFVQTLLASDFNYEQLQRYVARLLGVSENYEHIRFTRCNPDTRKPYFMKGKRRDLYNLTRLLTPATQHHNQLSKVVYYEFCKFTVPEIELAHSLQFKYFDDKVKAVSSHWVLLSREVQLNVHDLFEACAKEMNGALTQRQEAKRRQRELYPSPSPPQETVTDEASTEKYSVVPSGYGKWSSAQPTTADAPVDTVAMGQLGPGAAAVDSVQEPALIPEMLEQHHLVSGATVRGDDDEDYEFIIPEEAWKVLRLVDVWAGRIYNVFDKDHPIVLEKETFEESAEYRVERIPQPVPDVPLTHQLLLPVNHFTIIRNRSHPVETHGVPFSMYILLDEFPLDFLRRVASKLGVSYQSIVDWKVALVKENRVQPLNADIPMGRQVSEFCSEEQFKPNQRHPQKAAFVGLEHAPSKSNVGRDEGHGVKIYN